MATFAYRPLEIVQNKKCTLQSEKCGIHHLESKEIEMAWYVHLPTLFC